MQPGDPEMPPELARIRQLASELAEVDSGPAGELACALADAVLVLADRVDGLWQLIAAVVAAADQPPGAGQEPLAGPPPAEFLQALAAGRKPGRGAGHRGVRLSIGGREFVAAISPDQAPADPAGAWSALERLARSGDPGWPDPPD
ncbi:MAG TPA: hypothetical protein VFV41_05390 [Streptosporangiaceae bacterium]|nr:hypothetical protein [Streptosporangiaceae bacterium]